MTISGFQPAISRREEQYVAAKANRFVRLFIQLTGGE
jgi:hypothetical protein